jgi:DNA (cytosine-5)-methyltransferase 1
MTGRPLILSVFPGIDLLGRAFEEVWPEACLVRGPDLLWGGDIRAFHPPAGVFDGVIGGPPCQAFSRLRHLVENNGHAVAPDLIPEFERVVSEAEPQWFLMENVPAAPVPHVAGFAHVYTALVSDHHVGGETRRCRRFAFGCRGVGRLEVEWAALHTIEPETPVLASGGGMPVGCANGARAKTAREIATRKGASALGLKTEAYFAEALCLSGLPPDFLAGAPFTVAGKISCVGNGVPMAMGRAIARAVRRAVEGAR